MSVLVVAVALLVPNYLVGPDSLELDIESLVEGELVLQTRLFEVDSITVTVPEIRTDSASRMIELPVVRIRATGVQPAEPIFWLGGGPGQTNFRTFDYDYFIDRHDHVMVGYRGVDGSVDLDCSEVTLVLKQVKASAFPMLFHRETAVKVFDTYVAAANGDPSGLWLISIVAPFIFPEAFNWGENASKAVSADYESGRDFFRELMPEDAIIGAPLGAFLWAPAALWPIEHIEERYRTARETQVETLLLGGSVDFSTPAENVTTGLMPFMPNATHVVLSEMGHTMDLWRTRPEATHRMLTSFIETGVVDTSTVEYVPMDFSVRWGFPLLAKLVVGGILLLIVLALLGVSMGFRFFHRRQRLSTS